MLYHSLKSHLEWVEVVWKMLMHNRTILLGREIDITRGCLQGSPLSPLLRILLLEDLYR